MGEPPTSTHAHAPRLEMALGNGQNPRVFFKDSGIRVSTSDFIIQKQRDHIQKHESIMEAHLRGKGPGTKNLGDNVV